jgi:hypothetical protein
MKAQWSTSPPSTLNRHACNRPTERRASVPLTSIYTISREDLYDYRRCPKIVAIKAHRAIEALHHKPSPETSAAPAPRKLEPATIGMIGEAAVQLGFQGVPQALAMQQIARKIPEVNFNQYLEEIASQSLRGVEEVRRKLANEYADVTIIGRGEGRHPDLAGKVRPDFIAFRGQSSNPIVVESKDTMRRSSPDNFQAALYNGIAEKYGLYLIQQRLEGKSRIFSPCTLQGDAETLLIYPRLAEYAILREKFVPDSETIKEIWKAKELGFRGLVPETDCGAKCAHHRLKVKLPQANMEPLPPTPLIFSKGILEAGFNYDISYQATYAWNLLPQTVKLRILFSTQKAVKGLAEIRNWLTKVVGLDEQAADIVVNPIEREVFLRSKPDARSLLKSMESDLEPWKNILKESLVASAPSILALATTLYSLPKQSFQFVREAWDRWH